MKLSLEIDVAGEEQLNHHFGQLLTALDDFSEPLEAIGQAVERSTHENFVAEGRPKWEPLKEKYAAWKERHYPGQPILVRTGALRESMHRGGRGNIFDVTKTQVSYGSDLSVGSYNLGLLHQKLSDYTDEGTVVARMSGKGPPQRKIINLQKQEKNSIVQTLRQWLVKKGGLEP